MGDTKKFPQVEDVLTEKQVQYIVEKCSPGGQLVNSELRPATEGLSGFVGEHFRLKLQIQVEGQLRTVPLFVKCVPLHNEAKITFVRENGFFIREMTMFKLFEEIDTGPNLWAPKALFYNDSVVVMPDLAPDGYTTRPDQVKTFDLPHMQATLTSLARFHAAIANHETKKSLALERPYSLMEDYGNIIVESNFQDTPWIRTAAKLTANIIEKLSKYKDTISDLEANVLNQFLAGFADLRESDSLNVAIHKDLWSNNVMFKYEGDAPTNAVLLDFQCVRYGPPAFDVMTLLYFTTSRCFRERYEEILLRHYFKIFTECLDDETKLRMKTLGYDYKDFLRWIETSRRFGMVVTLVLYPYVLMEPVWANKVFNNPATFEKIAFEDRTEAVLEHAARSPEYGQRQLKLTEEFVERCLQK